MERLTGWPFPKGRGWWYPRAHQRNVVLVGPMDVAELRVLLVGM